MKKYICFLFLSSLFLLLTNCQKEIKFKGEITEPKLVLNSFVSADSIVNVHLSQSIFILEYNNNEFKDIENATVKLYVNDTFKETLQYDSKGWYRSRYVTREKDKIRLEASAEGLQSVSAESVIPSKPIINNVEEMHNIKMISEDDYNYYKDFPYLQLERINKVTITMQENPNEHNYYFIKITRSVYSHDSLETRHNIEVNLADIMQDNPVKNKINANNWFDFDMDDFDIGAMDNMFDDVLINGKNVRMQFHIFDKVYDKSDNENENNKSDEYKAEEIEIEYTIAVTEMSEDFYRYILSGQKANAENPFMEPVQIHNNIENGIGILGTYATYRYTFSFPSLYITKSYKENEND